MNAVFELWVVFNSALKKNLKLTAKVAKTNQTDKPKTTTVSC